LAKTIYLSGLAGLKQLSMVRKLPSHVLAKCWR
jgi:hypothetical protein